MATIEQRNPGFLSESSLPCYHRLTDGIDEENIESILGDIYYSIVSDLPEQIGKLPPRERESFEIMHLRKEFVENVIKYGNRDVGLFHDRFHGRHSFNNSTRLTVRELFLLAVISYDLPYTREESYRKLDSITSPQGDETKVEIRLSAIMDHRFDSQEYSFEEKNISKISMHRGNIDFFRRVSKMMNYLMGRGLLYINYPQFYESDSTSNPLVKPQSDKELHCSKGSNTYYSNHWEGSESFKGEHARIVMAILSFLKFCVDRKRHEELVL